MVKNMEKPSRELSRSVRQDATRVVDRFKDTRPSTLMAYVYRQFPWFTANSKVRRLCDRPLAPKRVYTVGYQGRLVDGFLDLLMRVGIRRVVDVRSNPVARGYGFHKIALARLCDKVQIEYLHFPQVGIGSDMRRGLKSLADYKALLAWYEAKTLPHQVPAVQRIAQLTKDKPTALMCMEADPSFCHRSRLAKAVARMTGLSACDLGGHDEGRI